MNININFNKPVESNSSLIQRLDGIQRKLTRTRYKDPLIRKKD